MSYLLILEISIFISLFICSTNMHNGLHKVHIHFANFFYEIIILYTIGIDVV